MRTQAIRAGLFFALCAIVWAYWPGLYGDFNFDDRPNILDNPRYKFDRLTWDVLVQIIGSGDAGTFKRPLPMISFALNIASTGFDPFYFKIWNLGIHLINVLLVFVAVRLLVRAYHLRLGLDATKAGLIALASATVWGLHPLNLTSVLYVVQRMNSLAATFVLLALCLYLIGRMRLMSGNRAGWWVMVIGAGGSTILGLLSKENAVLVPLFLLVVEISLLRFTAKSPQDSVIMKSLATALVLMIAASLCWIVIYGSESLLSGYAFRDFSMGERLLTQSRVLFFYLQMIFAPNNASLGLFHDDFAYSTNLFSPPITGVAVFGVFALVATAILTVRKLPVVSFAISWFLVGHLLESTFINLEMIHEHRNYIPILGPVFAVSYYLCTVRLSSHARVLPLLLLLFCCALGVSTWSRAYSWGNIVRHAEMEVANHPESERAIVQLGRIYFTLFDKERDERYFNEAEKLFLRATRLPRSQNGAFVGLIKLHYRAGRTPPQKIVEDYIARLATGPAAPSATVFLDNITKCNMFEYCRIPDEDMLRMYSAILNNSDVHPTVKSTASLFLAQYLIDHLGDGAIGINVLENAKKLEPRQLAIRRNLVRMYRLSGQLDRAATELREVRALDRFREIGPELDQEEIKLNEAIANRGVPLK